MKDTSQDSSENQIGLKWELKNKTWQNPNTPDEPMPRPFSCNKWDPSHNYQSIPSFIPLFDLF